MRIFIANLVTETNTFSPLPTGWRAWREFGLHRGDASRVAADQVHGVVLHAWRRLAEADGHEVVESVAGFATPGGRTLASVYAALRDDIVADLAAAGPVDAVLLNLHGAMAAEGCDDCEGELLAAVRRVAGPVTVIGAELDLHCHLTPAMLGAADVLVAYKHYPHDDMVERAREVYRLCLDAASGRIRPVTAAFDCRMIGLWPTTGPVMAPFVRELKDAERRPGVLSVSLGHGFPWADVADVGARVWAVTDGDLGLAERTAAELGRRFFELRSRTRTPYLTADEALDRALAAPRGPVVLADVADNPGGGAPGDSTFVLRRLLERGVRGVAAGCYWDPQAAALCAEAGAGAAFDLRLGGKSGPVSGDPLDLRVEVKALAEDHAQSGLSGARSPLGLSAWVRAEGVDLVLASVRSQTFAPDAFTGLGLDLADKALVVVKSTEHFRAAFAPLAADILYVATPGAIRPDFAAIPYARRDGRYWPRVADPFAAETGGAVR